MSDIALRVDNLGKRYRLGVEQGGRFRYKSLRDSLGGIARDPLKALRGAVVRQPMNEANSFWALHDINFEVKRGEVVGIIGRNGAGKSTLLKILSRITKPTVGRVTLYGRVGSLLEVGTGFHPELTGRENVYLNGAILGMTRAEVKSRFDEIVEFSETQKFLDTSVKHYSSGMYMRLAFAIAAHLDPEILIVDEVLAVGDLEFQKKCLGKMKDVAAGGRTVLFVSHSTAAIRSLCMTGLVLDAGRVASRASAGECLGYYAGTLADSALAATVVFTRPLGASPWMTSATVICGGKPNCALRMGETLSVEVKFASEAPVERPRFGVVLSTAAGERLLNLNNRFQPSEKYRVPVASGSIRCDLGVVPLVAGRYQLSLYFGEGSDDAHRAYDAIAFEVMDRDIWGQGKVPPAGFSLMWWPAQFSLLPGTASDVAC